MAEPAPPSAAALHNIANRWHLKSNFLVDQLGRYRSYLSHAVMAHKQSDATESILASNDALYILFESIKC